ncbi:MAG: hypothetical protein IMX01_06130 [Limnochordaceae bacterium]|nr:hypothetical protein [Limnochordaceae bacterium]
MATFEELEQEYALELRGTSYTLKCMRCNTFLDKYRTRTNAQVAHRALVYRCPKCGALIRSMRPLRTTRETPVID